MCLSLEFSFFSPYPLLASISFTSLFLHPLCVSALRKQRGKGKEKQNTKVLLFLHNFAQFIKFLESKFCTGPSSSSEAMAADRNSIFFAVVFLFSIWPVQYWQSLAIRPPEHSVVVHEDDATAISPAMIAFFRGHNRTAPPAANNSTVPKWRLPAPELKQKDNGVRTIALVAGVVCGAVGIGLLVTAAMAYVSHIRKPKPEVRQRAV